MQRAICICLALLTMVWLSAVAYAQALSPADLARWEALADRADAAVARDRTTEETLSTLRGQLVEFRSVFDEARNLNAARIATLREQIEALGPPPADGAQESTEAAERREALNVQLSAALAPVQRAEAEFVRADALISQIDTNLRDLQAEALLTVIPTPLNPLHWQPAWRDVVNSIRALWTQADPDPEDGAGDRRPWPLAIGLMVLGLVLIFRGRRWSHQIVTRLQRFGARGFGIWRFVVSLLRIILPFAGLLAIALAIGSLEILEEEGNDIVLGVAILGGIMLGVRWVSERVFSRDDDEALVMLPDRQRTQLRFYVAAITLFMVIAAFLQLVMEANNAPVLSIAVISAPLTLLSCLALFRIGVMLRGYTDPVAADAEISDEPRRVSTFSRMVRGLGTGAVLTACAAPLLLAAGYYQATRALLPPYIMTMALLGFVLALQRFAADVYGAISGEGHRARDALVPVLVGLVLLVLVAPVLALVWGARWTDLTELWSAFGRGFAIGDSRISPSDFLAFAVIFGIGYVLTRLLQSALKGSVLPKTRLDIGGQNAIVSGIGYVGIFLAAIIAITGAGIDLSSLALVASALTVGIGFGLQNIVSNFVSGIILLIERPISEGDWIEVGGQMGYVRNISVRSTRIETFDRTDVIVPNADLVSGTVTNYTRGNTLGRLIVPVGVAYGTDTKRVEGILREIAEAQPMVLANPAPAVLFLNFGADALEFEIRCFLRDVNWMMVVKSDINHAIAKRFVEEGIEVPFAQRDLWLRNPEALRGTTAGPEPDEGTPA